MNDGPKPAPDLVAGYRISDPPAYRVRHIHRRVFFGPIYETNSQWPALTPSGGCREERELPSGSNPTGHPSLRPSIGDDPCYDGPSGRHDQRESAFGRENHGFWLSSAYLADKYASLNLFSNCYFALRGTPWGSLARYWRQCYPTTGTTSAVSSKSEYGATPQAHRGSLASRNACG